MTWLKLTKNYTLYKTKLVLVRSKINQKCSIISQGIMPLHFIFLTLKKHFRFKKLHILLTVRKNKMACILRSVKCSRNHHKRTELKKKNKQSFILQYCIRVHTDELYFPKSFTWQSPHNSRTSTLTKYLRQLV